MSGAAFFAGCLATREALSPSGWDPAAVLRLCRSDLLGSLCCPGWAFVLVFVLFLAAFVVIACVLAVFVVLLLSLILLWSLACVRRVSKTACAFSSGLLFFRVVVCCVCCVCCGFEVWGVSGTREALSLRRRPSAWLGG